MFRLLLTYKTTSKDNKLSRILCSNFKLISLVDTTLNYNPMYKNVIALLLV